MPARFDADAAPHDDLLCMRRSTAQFARVLANLSDADIAKLPHRRVLLAEIGLQARALALQVKSLHSPLSDDETAFETDIAYTATLPVQALRHLVTHSALHLNVELRDLTDRFWPAARHIPKARASVMRAATRTLAQNAVLTRGSQPLLRPL